MKEMERKKPSEERKPDSGGYALQEVRIRLTEGQTLYSKYQISSAQDAIDIMREELAGYDREVVCIVNLNAAFQPINFNMVSMGTLNMSVVDVGNVLKSCLLSNAGSFIMLHNHPSGDVTPSKEDLSATKRMILAGALDASVVREYAAVLAGPYEHFNRAYQLGRQDGSIAREVDFALFYRSLAHALMSVGSKLSRGEVLPTDDFTSAHAELDCLIDMAIRSLRIKG